MIDESMERRRKNLDDEVIRPDIQSATVELMPDGVIKMRYRNISAADEQRIRDGLRELALMIEERFYGEGVLPNNIIRMGSINERNNR